MSFIYILCVIKRINQNNESKLFRSEGHFN